MTTDEAREALLNLYPTLRDVDREVLDALIAAVRAELEAERVKVARERNEVMAALKRSDERLRALRDFLILRPDGHVGPDRIPWFIHCGISHGENRPDCVVCAALAATEAEEEER